MSALSTLVDLFYDAVDATPENIAVEDGESKATYLQLDEASYNLALRLHSAHLNSHPHKRHKPVPLLTTHGVRNVVGILGILKAGCCYVPMDHGQWTPDRIEYVLGTIDSEIMVNATGIPFQREGYLVIDVNEAAMARPEILSDLAGLGPRCRLKPLHGIAPTDLSCIFFTSGTTGKPKGVMIKHQSLVNYAKTGPFNMNVTSRDRVLVSLSAAFDAFAGMLFSVLGNSGTLVVTSFPDRLQELATNCTILAFTPSILATIEPPGSLQAYQSLHTILLGGETPPPDLIRAWWSPERIILNAYGPTETTCASIMAIMEVSNRQGVVNTAIIGKAMDNSPIYLLDEELKEIKTSTQDGEIVISGRGLAEGYWKDPARTTEKFIKWNGRRIYRTGDYGRWVQNNKKEWVVEFRGRKDRVVKNRGFLVNLEADVEAAIFKADRAIRNAHAVKYQGKLVAAIVPCEIDTRALRNTLLHDLENFFVPDRIFAFSTLPTTANGKVDPAGVLKLLQDYDKKTRQKRQHEDDDEALLGEMHPNLRIVTEGMAHSLGLSVKEIDLNASFTSLGGQSLAMVTLTTHCRRNGLHVTAKDIFTHQSARKIAENCERRSELSARSDNGRNKRCKGIDYNTDLRKVLGIQNEATEIGHLTTLQLELIHGTLKKPGVNVVQVLIDFPRASTLAMKAAWEKVWQAEPLFWTRFMLDVAEGIQIVDTSSKFMWEEQIIDAGDPFQKTIQEAVLSVGLGTSLRCLHLTGAEMSTVVWTVHHSLLDGHSALIAIAKLCAAIRGEDVEAGPSFIPTATAIKEEGRKGRDEASNFWKKLLEDYPEEQELNLPPPSNPPASFLQQAEHVLKLEDLSTRDKLYAYARSIEVTPPAIFYAAWGIVLANYMQTDKVLLGAALSGRDLDLPSCSIVVGPVLNILPLPVHVERTSSSKDYIKLVFQTITSMTQYQFSTFEQTGRRITSLLAVQYDLPTNSEPYSVMQQNQRSWETTTLPLTVLVNEDLTLRFIYDTTRFEEAAITRLSTHYRNVLESLLQPQRLVGTCAKSMVSALEKTQFLREWNPVPAPLVRPDWTLKDAFEFSANAYGGIIAVERVGCTLSYTELNDKALRVAYELQSHVGPGDVVAIHADGSIGWIIAVVACIKASMTYCPLDEALPIQRRAAITHISKTKLLLYPEASQQRLGPRFDGVWLAVDQMLKASDRWMPIPKLPTMSKPRDDAVIVFTSGTTGEPKGVALHHQGLLALQETPAARMFSRPGMRIAQFMSTAFDYCQNEIFSTLCHGGTLVLREADDPFTHLKKVDSTAITPSVLGVLDPADYPNLKYIFPTGEPVPQSLVDTWAPGRIFINAYGPAECSICASFHPLEVGKPVTIGRAIKTARMYILDSHFDPVPVGVSGEIYLAGLQVTRGYLNNEEQTKSRFLQDPFYPEQRMYRTGDYARWTENGEIDYIGRVDRQVKVRGIRIELPSVEQKILYESNASAAAVVVRNGGLLAFVTPSTVDIPTLTQRLKAVLTPAWIPQVIIAMDKFPVTLNAKVDFRALANWSVPLERTDTVIEPLVTDTEKLIAAEWAKLLKLDSNIEISAIDTFCSLGGHSVLQLLLSARLSKEFYIRLSVRDVIQNQTLRSLAIRVDQLGMEAQSSLTSDKGTKSVAPDSLSPIEETFWLQLMVATCTTGFNVPFIARIGGSWDREKLIQAFNEVLERHEILRSRYMDCNGHPRRILSPEAPKVIQTSENSIIESELNYSFDLPSEDLIRVHITNDTLIMVMSHMLGDLTSVRVMLEEVTALYRGEILTPTVGRYIQAQTWTEQPRQEEFDFWTKYLAGNDGQLKLPIRPAPVTFEGASRYSFITGPLHTNLIKLLETTKATRHQLALTAVAITLQFLTGTNDIVLGSPFSNRKSIEEQSIIGLFLDRIPIRVHFDDENASCAALLKNVQSSSQSALGYSVPFHTLLNHLRVQPCLTSHPLFEAMVTFHLRPTLEQSFALRPETQVNEIRRWPQGSKFLLMFEWAEISDKEFTLRIEYDTLKIPPSTIQTIEQTLHTVLACLATSNKTYAQIKHSLTPFAFHSPPSSSSLSSTPDSSRILLIRETMAECLRIDLKAVLCTSSFFELGATSMDAVRLRSMLAARGVRVGFRDIFEERTAVALSQV